MKKIGPTINLKGKGVYIDHCSIKRGPSFQKDKENKASRKGKKKEETRTKVPPESTPSYKTLSQIGLRSVNMKRRGMQCWNY